MPQDNALTQNSLVTDEIDEAHAVYIEPSTGETIVADFTRGYRGGDGASISALHAWLIVIAAMTGSILEVLDTTITTTAVPQMMGNLGATLTEIGWVNTAYIVANVIILPIAGWLAGRLGRRLYFTGAVLVFTISSMMCGCSQDLSTLVFWRVIQGLGGGGLLATGQVILLDVFPKNKQSVPTAIYGAGVMSGPIFGPVLGGYLTENFSWPYIFFVNIPFGLIAAALTWWFVRDHSSERTDRGLTIDYIGILLLAVGMGSLQTVLERGREEDWFSSSQIVLLTLTATVGLLLFVVRQLKTRYPLIDLRILRDRALSAGSLYAWVLGFGIYGLGFLLPVYLQTLRGYNSYQSGMVQFPSGFAVMASFLVAGLISQRADPRVMMLFGTVGMVCGSAGLGFLTTQSGNDEIIAFLALRGFGLGFLFVPLTLGTLSSLGEKDIATGSAMINLTRQLGGSMGIAILSTMLSHRTDQHRANLAMHLGPDNNALRSALHDVQAALYQHGYPIAVTRHTAMRYIDYLLQRQATMIAFNDCYLVIAAAFVIALPLIALFKRPKGVVHMIGH